MFEKVPGLLWIALTAYLVILSGAKVKEVAEFQPQRETFTVQGQGQVTAVPDLARILLTIITEADEPASAQSDNTKKANKVREMLLEAGVAKEDIHTRQYSLEPVYTYRENKPPLVTGYRLSQTFAVSIRKLDSVGKILTAAVELGVNRADGPTFEVRDAEKLKSEARKLAFEDSRRKAQAMAEAAGVKVGRLLSFSESNPNQPPAMRAYAVMGRMSEKMDSESPVIEPGNQDLSVVVDVVYEIR